MKTMSTDLTITVPEEMQEEVAEWQDGEQYQVTIQQDGPGQFSLVSVEDSAEDEEDDEDETMPGDEQHADTNDRARTGSVGDTAGTNIPSKNPAVVALLMSKRGNK